MQLILCNDHKLEQLFRFRSESSWIGKYCVCIWVCKQKFCAAFLCCFLVVCYFSHSFSFFLFLSVFIPELFVRHVISNSIICYLTRSSCFKFFFLVLVYVIFLSFSQTDLNRICSNFGTHTYTYTECKQVQWTWEWRENKQIVHLKTFLTRTRQNIYVHRCNAAASMAAATTTMTTMTTMIATRITLAARRSAMKNTSGLFHWMRSQRKLWSRN